MTKNYSDSADNVQEAEIVGEEHKKTKAKKTRWKKGDYIVFFFWLLSIFAIVMSARLIALPSGEFPFWATVLIVIATIYITATSYAASLSPNSTRAILPNLFAFALLYILPALFAMLIINESAPKTEIVKRENDAIELQYIDYDVSFWFDADITYYRPFVPIFPFDTAEVSVGHVYYDGQTYDMGDCLNSDGGFYKGETITCPTEDNMYAKVRLNLDKLSYKVK